MDGSFCRGTAAQNTSASAGADSTGMSGALNWGDKARVALREFGGDADTWFVEAEHDGYGQRFGLYHRRRVAACGPSRIAITDTLQGGGLPQLVEIGFLVDPSLRIERRSGAWWIDDGSQPLLSIGYQGPLEGAVEAGVIQPLSGWVSDRFARKDPCPRLVFRGTLPVGETSVVHLDLPGS